ncbi:MAG: helix-turn-helix domain-containing protein [Candidatus Bathyarchaeia archaeon]|jgi:predicted DNA binding protein
MRRLVLELSIKDQIKKLKDLENLKDVDKSESEFPNQEIKSLEIPPGLKLLDMLQKIKSLEMLHVLRFDQDEFAAIFKVEIKDPSFNIEDLFNNKEMAHGAKVELHLLEKEKEGTCIYFMKGKPPHSSPEANSKKLSIYPFMPFSLRDGKVRVTLLGDNDQMKEALEFLEKAGNFKVISLMDAKFLPSSPVSRLTEKQREAIILAFNLGYFDTPRKISSEQLANKLGLANSTLAVHLRRAERRLLAEMLNE